MKTLWRSIAVVALVTLLMVAGVLAQSRYAEIVVDVPVDASASSDLVVTPETITVSAVRPGDQLAFEVIVENRGTEMCKDIISTQREMPPGLSMLTWATGPVPSMGSALVRVILSVANNAPDGTLSLRLGLICVQ